MFEHSDSMAKRAPGFFLLSLLGALAVCHAVGAAPAPQVELQHCHLKGIETALRCGRVSVLENRKDLRPDAKRIAIWFALMPSIARAKLLDPVVVIAGGPGQSASSVAGQVMPLFAKLNRNRDIVFIDQRGTGHSNPLNCPPPKGASDLASQLDPDLIVAALTQCAAGFAAQHTDVRHYLTEDAAADLDTVRQALGYQSINLWSASYGTRVALEYLRDYPDQVRSAVLDGPAPSTMQLPLSLAIDADHALSLTIDGCAKEPLCASAHPQLAAQVDQLFQQLSQHHVQAKITDPTTGHGFDVALGADTFAAWLRQPLYTPVTASLVPQAIADASLGQFNTLAALNLSVGGDVFDELSLGMHLSVVCSEDMAQITPADLASVATTRFKTSFYALYRSMCDHWPKGQPSKTFFQPVHSDRPVLMLAGGRDPATPPRHARALLPDLPNARLIVAEALGHGLSGAACGPDLIDQFFRTAKPQDLDAACLERVPPVPFFMPPSAATAP